MYISQEFFPCGYTSDHILVTAKVNNHIIHTWNILERCFSKADGLWGYSNNPLNITESKDNYIKRKLEQFSIIKEQCKNATFFLLQEADFLFPELDKGRMNKDKSVTAWSPEVYKYLTETFDKLLQEIGWDMLTYESKEMAILYNKKYVNLVENSERYLLEYKNRWESKKLLFMADFVDFEKKKISVGTVHLNYAIDYSESIPLLLKELQEEDRIVIFGGDTNHPASFQMSNLLVPSEQKATNFHTNYSKFDNGYTKVDVNDERMNSVAKAYDGFFVAPPIGRTLSVSVYCDGYWDYLNGVESQQLIYMPGHISTQYTV